jgi:hypothetical protein
MAHRVLAGQLRGLVGHVRGHDLDLAQHPPAPKSHGEGNRDRSAPGPHVGDGEGWCARRSRRPAQAIGDLREGEAHEQLGLGSRDQRPGIHGEGDPVELLEAAEIRDRLACRAAADVIVEPRRGLRADACLRVGEQGGPLDVQRVRQQQLSVQAGALRPARAETLDRPGEELADRRHRGVRGSGQMPGPMRSRPPR